MIFLKKGNKIKELKDSGVAQRPRTKFSLRDSSVVERLPVKEDVAGSNPAPGAKGWYGVNAAALCIGCRPAP